MAVGLPAEVLEGGRRAAALEEVLQVWGGVQTPVVWGAGHPAEACPPEDPSVSLRLLAETSGRPLEEGWVCP